MRERTIQPVTMRAARRGGFTLIEIMVALVIFVFGAMAILRIFPQGLSIVRSTEDMATATRLSAGGVNVYESKEALTPEAVYQFDASATPSNGFWAPPALSPTAPLIYPGGINSNSLPTGPLSDITVTTLGNLRRIRGEVQKVKICSIGPTTTAPYLLTRFPYVGDVYVYREENIDGVRIDASGALDFSQATLQGQPFNGGTTFPTRPPSSARHSMTFPEVGGDSTYYVSYFWSAAPATLPANPRIQGVTDENLRMPADGSWNVATDGHTLNTTNVLPGKVKVRLRRLNAKVSPTAAPAPLTADTGYVGLVPLPSAFADGDLVTLDYTVKDWKGLIHDEVVSTPSSLPAPAPVNKLWDVKLPILGVDGDLGVTTLFVRPNPNPATPPRLEWAQLNTPVTPPASSLVNLDGAGGRLTYDTVDRTLTRTVYATLDGWAHQIGVSSRSYEPFISSRPASSPREGWRDYVWVPNSGSSSAKLYFQPSEAGKTILVTYEYMDGTTPRVVSNALVPIGDDLEVPAATMPTGFLATNTAAAAQLTDIYGNPLGLNLIAIRSVRGASTMARTAWVKGQRYSQVIAKGMRPLPQ